MNFRPLANVWLISLIIIATVLLVPFLLGVVAAWTKRKTDARSNMSSTTKTAWDYAFLKRSKSLVEVELKDGSKVAGVFGTVSNYPYPHEIFISHQWEMDGDKPSSEIPESRGVLVIGDDIRRIRFFEYRSTGG
jgi:hypothetical protein